MPPNPFVTTFANAEPITIEHKGTGARPWTLVSVAYDPDASLPLTARLVSPDGASTEINVGGEHVAPLASVVARPIGRHARCARTSRLGRHQMEWLR